MTGKETQVSKVKGTISINSIIFTAVFLCLTATNHAQAQPADSPWPMYRYDAQGTAKSPYTGTSNPVVKWNFSRDYFFRPLTLAKDGTIYSNKQWTEYSGSPLYAVNPNGAPKWVTDFATSASNTRHIPTLASDGTFYVCGWGLNGVDTLYAIDTADGHKIWQLDIGGANISPIVASNGMIYVPGNGNLYAIQPSGNILWKSGDLEHFQNYSFAPVSIALSPDETTLYTFVDRRYTWLTSYFSAIEAASGDTLWSSYLWIREFAVGDNGTIYAMHWRNAPDPDQLVALSPADGERKWGVDMPYDHNMPHLPAIDGNTIYVAIGDTLFAITDSGSLGTVKWKRKMASAITNPPVVDAAGTIYVVLQNGGPLCALDPDNGDIKWQRNASRGITTPPVIDEDGTLYVGHDRGIFAMGPWMAGYWDFNDESGSTLTEITGNSVDGIIHDAAWVDNGQCGHALYFDGSDDYVEIPYIPSIKPESEITVELWFKMEEYSDSTLLSTAWSGGYRFYFEDDSLVWGLGVAGFSKVRIAQEDISLNKWHFLTGTYDGNALKVYLDGILKDELSVDGGIGYGYANSLIIGAHCGPGTGPNGSYFKGFIDEVRIYSYGLNQSQIQQDMDTCWPSKIEKTTSSSNVPNTFALYQNHPNPFNPVTTIRYSIPQNTRVILKVFDTLGRAITTLVNEEQPAGTYQLGWNGLDKNGDLVPSGVYFYSLKTDSFTDIKKMMLLR